MPEDIIFNSENRWGVSKVLDGPRHDNDPLKDMYRVKDIEGLYKQNFMFLATPWMLSPSTHKIVYDSALGDFWKGVGLSGGFNFGLSVVGYSLPHHDVYARQAIYSLVKNYQNICWKKRISGNKKTPLVLVDYQSTHEGLGKLKQTYKFVDFDKTELHMSGFDMDSLEKIFA